MYSFSRSCSREVLRKVKNCGRSLPYCFLNLKFEYVLLSNPFDGWGLSKCAESVMVMPNFGVQLETHFRSGKVLRRFVPVDKILKPVLLECLTPVTCYWSLSLIVQGEDELLLVFKELRPPVKMLVPIWKALCTATGDDKNGDACS
uniref:Phosphatidylinositol N-acetylglucosaminyltransferase subunit H conserved domain-containing protein n=1 Tax=Cucumis melo TaxID=3656 RepID=A0A9I9D689_CUCME